MDSVGQLPSLSELRELVAVAATRYSIILSFPLVVLSLYRALTGVWTWYVTVQILAYLALVLGLLFRSKLRSVQLSSILVLVVMVVGIAGIAAWGPAPSRFIVLLSSCVFSAVLHGLRRSMLHVFVTSLFVCIAAQFNIRFGVLPGGDAISDHSYEQWVVTIVSYLFYSSVGVLMVSWVSGMLQKTIVSLKERDEDLRRSNDLLQQQAVDLEEQAVELEEQAEALREQRDRAQSSARAKEQFLNVVSHELRTPLNPIIGFAELIEEEGSLNDETREELFLMKRSARQLLKMINRVVNYSEIDRGELTVNKSIVTFGELKEQLEKHFEEVSKKRVDFTVKCLCSPLQSIELERRLVLHVVEELVGNGFKFTEKGSVSVELDLEQIGDSAYQICVCVKDTGCGIDDSRLKEIFDPFVLLDQGLTREGRGMGLGLAISSSIADALGGELSARSEVGEGAEFVFKVPVGVKRAVDTENRQCNGPTVFENRIRVLVAEDDFVNQRVVSKMLKRMGADCVCVDNGKMALDQVSNEAFDLVLMDVSMPIMDGIEATQKLRLLKGSEELPIIALTAHSYAKAEEACYDAGMDAFLTKPIQKKRLFETIKRFSGKPEFKKIEASSV